MADTETPPSPDAPDWLGRATRRAMAAAHARLLAQGADAADAEEAAAEMARAHHPALPARMIAEAVAAVAPPRPAGKGGLCARARDGGLRNDTTSRDGGQRNDATSRDGGQRNGATS